MITTLRPLSDNDFTFLGGVRHGDDCPASLAEIGRDLLVVGLDDGGEAALEVIAGPDDEGYLPPCGAIRFRATFASVHDAAWAVTGLRAQGVL